MFTILDYNTVFDGVTLVACTRCLEMGKATKKKVVVLTGTKAYPIIVEMVEKAKNIIKNVEISVELLPFPVIGMANVKSIKAVLLRKNDLLARLRKADYIILPGKVEGDASELEKLVGKPVFKGTTEPSHLAEIIKMIMEGEELSKIEPADKFIESTRLDSFINSLKEVHKTFKTAFKVSGISIPLRGPPVLIASETTVTLSPEEAASQAVYFEESGADFVIVGVPYGEDTSKSIERLKAVDRALNNAVIAIDSASPHTLKKAVEYGVELVFSLHSGNMEYLRSVSKNAAFVVIPGDPYRGIAPVSDGDSIAMLLKNLERAKSLGYDRLIADLVLPPPILGLSRTISAYLTLSKTLPDVPLMAGLANVTELVDADSIGVNAILSIISVEIGLSMVLVSEESGKVLGSTLETMLGLSLATVAKVKGSAPVGQGVDLLVAKDKKKPLSRKIWENAETVLEIKDYTDKHELDRWGYVEVDIDYNARMIVVCVHTLNKDTKCYRGVKPISLLKKILSDFPQFSKEHAGYMGIELEKAYTALKLRKQYIQDEDIILGLDQKYDALVKLLKELKQKQLYKRIF